LPQRRDFAIRQCRPRTAHNARLEPDHLGARAGAANFAVKPNMKGNQQKMNNDEIDNRALTLTTKHPRGRYLTNGTEPDEANARGLGNLLHGFGGDQDKFGAGVEALAYRFGVTTLLQPEPLPEKVFPEAWPELTNEPQSDPFLRERELDKLRLQWFGRETPKLKQMLGRMENEIKADQRALFESNPDLYEYRKQMAATPYATVIKMKAEEFDRQEHNALLKSYFSREENHRKNVYLVGTRTDQARLEKENPKLAALQRREARPLFLGVEGKPLFGKRRHETTLNNIKKAADAGDQGAAELFNAIKLGEEREKAFHADLHEQRVQQKIALAIRAREEKLALIDHEHGVQRTSDGRIITNAAA
jgi:hypothetical protein